MKRREGRNPILTALTVILTILALFLASGIFTIFSMGRTVCTVQGTSMEPTIMDGTVMLLNPQKEIDRFAIAVFEENGNYIIKRVVGIPGDTVTVLDGHLFVNGELYNEPYVDLDYSEEFSQESFKVEVPEGSYYVLGDNRDGSFDSRGAGTIPAEDVTGVAILTLKKG